MISKHKYCDVYFIVWYYSIVDDIINQEQLMSYVGMVYHQE